MAYETKVILKLIYDVAKSSKTKAEFLKKLNEITPKSMKSADSESADKETPWEE